MTVEIINHRRRRLLESLAAGAAALGAASLSSPLWASSGFVVPAGYADAATAAAFWAQPRVLRLYRPATGESVEASFWTNGALDWDGYVRICRLMRDARAGEAATIDVRLLNLLRGVQSWLALNHGVSAPLHITSGFRTAHTNATTEGAAKNSLHTRGMAVDCRIPGIPTADLGGLFSAFQGGGVGLYLDRRNFIHADVGRVRAWRG